MFIRSLKAGVTGIVGRPGLILLIYASNLIVAFILTVPLYQVLHDVVGARGFGPELAASFDLVVWADIWRDFGATFGALWSQLLWMVPLYLVWNAASSVGLIHALRGAHVRSFWQGVGYYTGRAVLVGVLFLLPLLGWGVLTVGLGFVLGASWSGEVGGFWSFGVIVPTFLFTGIAVIDLMRDYGWIAVVCDEQKAKRAWITGMKWPLRHGLSSWLYLSWFGVSALAFVIPFVLDMNVTAATAGGIWGLFLLQQLLLLIRAAIKVGWLGSETAFFEAIQLRDAPLIASESPPKPTAEAPVTDAPDAPSLT